MNASDPIATVNAAWKDDAPSWVKRLAEECAKTSQGKVARKLGKSGTYVSQILHKKYPGDMKSAEEIFLGVFENGLIQCPGLGDIPGQKCHEWQKKARRFAATNSERARMFRACRNCARFTGEE